MTLPIHLWVGDVRRHIGRSAHERVHRQLHLNAESPELEGRSAALIDHPAQHGHVPRRTSATGM